MTCPVYKIVLRMVLHKYQNAGNSAVLTEEVNKNVFSRRLKVLIDVAS